MKLRLPNTPSLLFFFLLVSGSALAQNPIIYSQYFLNPYQFNPSYAAHSGHYEANLLYRKQWMGIENAPQAGALNLQAPLGRNVSVGFLAQSSKTVLLRNTTVSGSFGYRVRLGYYHNLDFGLAGGIGLNNFDMAAVAASNDPTLNNVLQKNTYVMSQFGVNYTWRNFNLGFALPELLETKPNSTESFQEVKFNPFSQKFASASYTMNITRDVRISPIVIYRAINTEDFQLEGMLTATYKNVFWLGASYREGYGITAFIGFKAKDLLKIGYAYDRPVGKLAEATTGSHEFYAGTRFGKRDREEEYFASKKSKDSLAQATQLAREEKKKEEPVVVKTEPVKEPVKKQPVVQDTVAVKQEPIIVQQEPVKEEPIAEPKAEEKKVAPKNDPYALHGFYVVVGAYRSKENAMKQIRQLRSESMFPELLYMLERNFYYVYLYHNAKDRSKAIDELQRARNKYPRAWLYEPDRAEQLEQHKDN